MTRQKILVVEDEADILDVLTYNLKKEGYRVLASRNGAEAWELIRRELPDLVLLDRMLPGMDGIEICRRLKGDPVAQTLIQEILDAATHAPNSLNTQPYRFIVVRDREGAIRAHSHARFASP